MPRSLLVTNSVMVTMHWLKVTRIGRLDMAGISRLVKRRLDNLMMWKISRLVMRKMSWLMIRKLSCLMMRSMRRLIFKRGSTSLVGPGIVGKPCGVDQILAAAGEMVNIAPLGSGMVHALAVALDMAARVYEGEA